MKICAACHVEKDEAAFSLCRSAKDGRQARCKECDSAWAKAHRASKRAARNAYYARNRDAEVAKVIAWRERDGSRAKVRANNARYLKKNATMICARKRAAKHTATPGWANPKAIKAIYAEARRLTMETGREHHVDHIIPLKSPLVCGLHWEGNLQILTREANIKKANHLGR